MKNDEIEAQYYHALRKCSARYEAIVFKYGYFEHEDKDLLEFIFEFNSGIENKLSLYKLNRWLGYIQGCLIERCYTSVEAERNWTRPLFKPLDLAQ